MTANIVLMKDSVGEKEDGYLGVLSAVGNVTSLPVLSFEFFNLAQLHAELAAGQKWNGVIFTSKRSVEAVEQVMREHKCQNISGLSPSWSELPCYAIGEATRLAAEQLGFRCHGEKLGTAKALAAFIVEEASSFDTVKSLLFVCGMSRRDDLPTILNQEKIPFVEISTYRTVANAATKSSLQNYVAENGIPSFVVYFSPSGVNFSFDMWQELLGSHDKTTNFVSIGPTTTKALNLKGVEDVATASFPSPDKVLEAIKDLL